MSISSFSHPNMLDQKSGGFKVGDEASLIRQNIKLLLNSTKKELLGDPYFGTNLKRYLFEPNDLVLRDLIIDEVYNAIRLFIKQVSLERNSIVVTLNNNKLTISFKLLYNYNKQIDVFSIVLMEGDE